MEIDKTIIHTLDFIEKTKKSCNNSIKAKKELKTLIYEGF